MSEPEKERRQRDAAGTAVVILACGISIALNVITCALLYAAIVRLGIDVDSGISDNGVQVLLAWGGAMLSVIAGFCGYVVGKGRKNGEHEDDQPA